MISYPTGTITFLFTDIEGSTKLWEQQPEAMRPALARHDALLRQAIEAQGGYLFKMVGDAACAAFVTAPAALQAALRAQRALYAESWGATVIKVRMALHTGATEERDGDYFGPPVNRVARLLSAGHGGQTLLSSATQELVRDCLPEQVTLRDLGEHRLKDLIRPEHIFQLLAPDLPSEFPPLHTLNQQTQNLPAQTTTFIGRETEVAAVVHLLSRSDVRLLTLTGPGGTGKTRLSLQAAAEMLEQFADGVCFVPLAPISDPAFVVPTIAHTLGLQLSGATPPLELVKTYLHAKHLLLVLDNFEQVLDAAPAITEMLTAAPHMKILVTSRTVLRVSGEHNYPVPALNLPDPKHDLSLASLTQYEAVRLFIERAQAAKPDFAVTNANAPAVAEICVRLDGLPLAIELAAARVRLLPPQKMLLQLEHRLKFLTGGARDVPARQQALRNTIEWSYQLLTEEEKTLFRRLAVFVGGCTLEAIEAVCKGDPLFDIFSGVESLVDKSLLKQIEINEEGRFTMLETICEYAFNRLTEGGEAEIIQQQHAQYFLAFAEKAEQHFYTLDQAHWFDCLDTEYNNLRTALAWSVDHNRACGLRIAVALGHFWRERNKQSEGRAWFAKLLTQSQENTPDMDIVRLKALRHAGRLAYDQNDMSMGDTCLTESVALCRKVGDKRGLAYALIELATESPKSSRDFRLRCSLLEESILLFRQIDYNVGLGVSLLHYAFTQCATHNYEHVHTIVKEIIALTRKTGDIPVEGCAVGILGYIAFAQDDYVTAQTLFEQAGKLCQQAKADIGNATILLYLGESCYLHGDYQQASLSYDKSLKLFQERGDKRGTAQVLTCLGYIALHQGCWQDAQKRFTTSLPLLQEYDKKGGVARCLTGLARLFEHQGQIDRVTRLLGFVHSILETIEIYLPFSFQEPAITQTECQRIEVAVRNALGEEAFAAAFAKGREMTLEQAIALATGES